MKKGVVAGAVLVLGISGAWLYTKNAAAEEATNASAATAIMGKHGKEGKADKGDKKAQRAEGGPLFKAASSLSGLTDEQKTKLEALKSGFNEKMKELRKSDGAAPADEQAKKQARKDARAKVQSLTDETKVQIDQVLTDSQKSEFATKLQAQVQEMKDKKTSGTKTE